MFETITFLTDFGLRDDFVGVCRGVMRRIAPDAVVLDLTHGIAPQAVARGALVLARAVPYLPVAVHLAVVDPGVGGRRRAIAIRTEDGRVFVGPDNGLLTPAADPLTVAEARSLTNARYHLAPVSRTFQARDIFAPVAAHLAAGVHLDELGEAIDPASLVRLDLPRPDHVGGELRAEVADVDRFGNVELNATAADLGALGVGRGSRVELRFPLGSHRAVVAETYAAASPGELIVYEDSYGAVAIALSGGAAASLTRAGVGDEVGIRPVEPGSVAGGPRSGD